MPKCRATCDGVEPRAQTALPTETRQTSPDVFTKHREHVFSSVAVFDHHEDEAQDLAAVRAQRERRCSTFIPISQCGLDEGLDVNLLHVRCSIGHRAKSGEDPMRTSFCRCQYSYRVPGHA